MRDEKYRKSRAINQSSLKELQKSSRRFESQYVLGDGQNAETDAMVFGTLYHTMMLQPHLVDDMFVVIPEDALASNGHRRGKKYDEFLESNKDKYCITSEDFEKAKLLSQRTNNHPFMQLVNSWRWRVEEAIYWTDPQTEVECKAIPDIVCKDDWIVDLKTTKDLTGFVFDRDGYTSKSIVDFDYHLQAAFYLRGTSIYYERPFSRYALVVAETSLPFRVYAMELSPAALFAGEAKLQKLLAEYAWRSRENDWSEDGERALLQVDIPAWAK